MSDRTNTKTQSDEIDFLLCRSELYGALSLLYRHPASIRRDLLLEEQRRSWREAVILLDYPNKSQLVASLDLLTKELETINSHDWAALYDDCFSHTAHGAVSIYELEYGEEHTHRQPQQLGDIAAFYQAFGLKTNEKNHERVDHISAECEFVHFLIFKEAYAVEHDGKEKSELCRHACFQFLEEHLGRWAPSFALRLSKYAKQGLFKPLADLTLLFIVEDCKSQGIIPGLRDLPIRSVNEQLDSGCMSCSVKPGFQC
jgi:putative dimethyl sulfoxide reductase chaperone